MATKNETENAPKKVSVTLPPARDGEDPIYLVAINGVNYQIPLGETVEVPDFVAYEINRSKRAEQAMIKNAKAMLDERKQK